MMRFSPHDCYLKSPKGCNSNVSRQQLWFLRRMLVNSCMKFHEDALNGFKVTELTRLCLRNCYLQTSKGHNSKRINTRVMVLHSARRPMLVNICMKVHKDTLNGFQVTERTRFCDGQADGWTNGRTDDPSKNNMSPNPKEGRHNKCFVPMNSNFTSCTVENK